MSAGTSRPTGGTAMRASTWRVSGWVAVAATVFACVVSPAGAAPSAIARASWTRQFGTDGADFVGDVDASANATYVVGRLGDPGDIDLRRYSADGSARWSRR